MTVFFTSDLHVNHAFVATLRGFGTDREDADIAAHDEAIADGWADTVRSKDQVWVLGDIIGNPGKYRVALNLLSRLPGTKHLIAGNHDPVSPVHRDAHRYQREFLEVFDSVQAYARRRINGVQALLSHYPYAGAGSDHTDVPRYGQHRLPDLGAVLLHGHTHLADQRLHLSDAGTPQVHVGVDAWAMKPVSLDTITTLLDA